MENNNKMNMLEKLLGFHFEDRYEYTNARIRGMKPKLMSKSRLEEFVEMEDVNSILRELENTTYKDDIEKTIIRYPLPQCVDEAFKENLSRTFKKILRIAEEGEPKTLVKVLLRKWDVLNIKTILRGKSAKISKKEISENVIPIGELDEVALKELIEQETVEAVINMLMILGSPYSKPLKMSLKEYKKMKSLAPLEDTLDKFYYNHTLEMTEGECENLRLVREMITTEIDIVNIRTVLKSIKANVDVEFAKKFLIKNGKELKIGRLVDLIKTRNIQQVVVNLKETSYGPAMEKGWKNYSKTGSITDFENELEKFMIKKGVGMFRKDPLGVGIIIGYMYAKENEIRNLRMITRCKDIGIPPKDIEEVLTIV